MNKRISIIVLTGAGASRAEPICLPTMTEFFKQIMTDDRNPKSGRIGDPEYFKFIFNTLYANETNYDLERVMGALYNLKTFTNNDAWKIFQHPKLFDNQIEGLYAQFSTIASRNGGNHNINDGQSRSILESKANQTYEEYKRKAQTLIFELEDLIREKYETIPNAHIRSVYEPFFEFLLLSHKHGKNNDAPIIPFFTTNYDMSVDWFFDPESDADITTHETWLKNYPKIDLIDGFNQRGWNRSTYTIDEESNDTIFIPYFKLHGSLFWEKRKGRIRKGTNTANDQHYPKELMLVYPSDKKELLEDPFHFNHQMLDSYLKRTDLLIVIGFSFRDPAIVRSIETSLLDNTELNIIVIVPEGFDPSYFPEMNKFLKLERVIWIKGYFGDQQTINELEEAVKNLKGFF